MVDFLIKHLSLFYNKSGDLVSWPYLSVCRSLTNTSDGFSYKHQVAGGYSNHVYLLIACINNPHGTLKV